MDTDLIKAHSFGHQICHQLDLRSISTRGRPTDSFGDPVLRVRAWYWLARVQEISGLSDPRALDRSRLVADVSQGRRFQSIVDDGFDPGRVEVSATRSLLMHVSDKRKYRSTQLDYAHSLWVALRDRSWQPPDPSAWIERALRGVGVVALEWGDASRAREIGLDWPDFSEEGDPAALPLHALVEMEKLATLDGLLLLLLLYRRFLDRAQSRFAEELRQTISMASGIFEEVFRDEALDTWRLVLNTHFLSWMPDFRPSETALKKAVEIVWERFEATRFTGPGRAPLHPKNATSGKIERRWRRRTLVIASALDGRPSTELAGFRALTPFNEWLITNRHLIDSHLYTAIEKIMLESGADPAGDDQASTELPPLEIPTDDQHRISRPASDPWYDYTIGDLPFDRISIRPRKIEK